MAERKQILSDLSSEIADVNIRETNHILKNLSGVNLIPLFKFLRGARGVTKSAIKAADASKKLKPPVEEPLPLAPSKDVLPEVKPFTPKTIAEKGINVLL
tara:strand:+ start:727 stop:1026 length:300 start_codon:yes stop_codon:yes gene_type:complete